MLKKYFSNIKFQHFVLLFVGAVVIYAELMIHQLTNGNDGVWESSFHNAGAWELSLGRWFWQYISRLRFGTSVDPYTSLITLALMVMGLLLLFDLWQITDKYTIIISGLLFLSHAAICFELSYRYMSPTFGVAFLLSILAVWCFEKVNQPIISVSAGALCIVCSMGSYQAYICCTAVAFLTALLIKLARNINWKNILIFCGKSITGIVLGGIGYIIALNIYLRQSGIEMSDYQGGSSYSILNSIQCLPESMYKVYQFFTLYFRGVLYKINRMQGKHIFTVMFVLVCILIILRILKLWKQDKLKAVLFGGVAFLYPAAALSILMITTDIGLALQMACGPALFLTALPCLFYCGGNSPEEKTEETGNEPLHRKCSKIIDKGNRVIYRIFVLFMCVVLYGSICQVVIDQNTMYEGRVATETIADMIVDKLLQEDLIQSDYRYVFVGTPVSCLLYSVGPNYAYSNYYALYGAWYLGNNCAKSWNGVIKNRKGLYLDMVMGPEYEALSSSEMVEGMPQFPDRGSILLDDNIVYVKIGNAK